MWKNNISTYQKGFTLIEFMLVSAILAVLLGLVSLSLMNIQHKSQLSATTDTFLADMKEQQIKAMSGDAESGVGDANYNYGIRFSGSSYTVFRSTYGTSNFVVSFPSTIQGSTSASNSEIVFQKGSGELTAPATITLSDTVDKSHKIIQLNRLGVVTSISN